MQSLNLDFSFSFQNKSVDISLIYVRKPTLCFVHSIFRFWFLVTFGHEVMKMRKYYVIFVYILQGKMGKTGKNRKKITQLKSLKYQNPKDENMGWKKHLQLKFHSLIRRLTRGRSKSRPICTKLQIPTTIISSALNSYTFLIVAEWTKKALISH